MIFSYKKWAKFCAELRAKGLRSVPACCVDALTHNYIVLKHDVETNVKRAYEIARIEHQNGHSGSFYVQAYLLDDEANIRLLKEMQDMGHEISYHHDVMDSCRGDLQAAAEEFEKNRVRFEFCGFQIRTVCQHGNPIVERKGYTSNRDFFRSEYVQRKYPDISDIMVNYKQNYSTDYRYYSDAGRCIKGIYDPLNNDLVDSSEKDVVYVDLGELLCSLVVDKNHIVSIHPHRWTKSAASYIVKTALFRIVRILAKWLVKIPVMKKVMSRHYHLAKKL